MLRWGSSGARILGEGLENVGRILAPAVEAGVTVLTGTDLGLAHGDVAREAALLKSYGLSDRAAVAAATESAYRYLGVPYLTPGASADVVLFDADPNDDVAELQRPVAAMRAGRVDFRPCRCIRPRSDRLEGLPAKSPELIASGGANRSEGSMRRPLLLAVAVCLVAGSLISPAMGQTLPPGGTFVDDDGNLHEGTIEAIFAAGITTGCGPALYCPTSPVTREQMAVFPHTRHSTRAPRLRPELSLTYPRASSRATSSGSPNSGSPPVTRTAPSARPTRSPGARWR